MFHSRKATALVAVVALLAGACSTSSGTAAPASNAAPASVAAAGCKVGVSWNNYQEERWAKWDEPAIKDALTTGGATYISNDAKSSSDDSGQQRREPDHPGREGRHHPCPGWNGNQVLRHQGHSAKASASSPTTASSRMRGALYITFDNVEVGRMQARAVFAAKPKGNYVIIKGNSADANADFLRAGIEEIIGAAVKSGDIKIVGETYTPNWDPAAAKTEMEQFLTANANKVDAVVSENDGMAGGVIAALTSQGMAGTVPVSGQDGDARRSEPRRSRHSDRGRLEGRSRAGQGRR